MQKYLHERHNRLINDLKIILSDPTRRKELWTTNLNTIVRYGMNVGEWLLISSLSGSLA